jgi:hypothetical protein
MQNLAYYKDAGVMLRQQIAAEPKPHLKRELEKALKFAKRRIEQMERQIFSKGKV